MPVAAGKASRQFAPPADDRPPQHHPSADLVRDGDAVARTRSGEVYAARLRQRAEPAETEELPEELVADHTPLGGLDEQEWELRYRRDEGWSWPSGEEAEPVVLEPDEVVDHLGDGAGRMLFAPATPFARRALPPEHRRLPYRRYRVMRPLPVWRGEAEPWFGQPGGGVRYRTTYPLVELVAMGYLVELTAQRRNAEERTQRIESARAQEAGT
ncbi:TNT domain-containing protein [Saccharopolyspora cebuensis]